MFIELTIIGGVVSIARDKIVAVTTDDETRNTGVHLVNDIDPFYVTESYKEVVEKLND